MVPIPARSATSGRFSWAISGSAGTVADSTEPDNVFSIEWIGTGSYSLEMDQCNWLEWYEPNWTVLNKTELKQNNRADPNQIR